jgi:cholinesterase
MCRFDGAPLVNSTGLIIVTMNYRLGALGFAAIQGSINGNFGFFDQRLALIWVQQNIAAFGGDPAQVTLFGQSAGATSVVTHLMAKGSWGTYARAIVQSSPLELPLKPISDAYDLGARLAKKLKCNTNDLDCLRSKSMDEIVAAQQAVESHLYLLKPIEVFFPWTPVVDGVSILALAKPHSILSSCSP